MRKIPAASLVGIALLLPAGAIAAGWLLRNRTLIALIPGAPMVFNTALCFCLTALALAANDLAPRPRRNAQTLLGMLVALFGALVLAQHLFGFNLGIDWPGPHRWYIDSNPFPGRMSVLTSLAFLLCGLGLALMHRIRGLWDGLLLQAAAIAIAAIGGIGAIGYLLKLQLVYREYLFGQMALPTAIGLVLAGAGLGLCWHGDQWYRARRLITRHEQRITLNGAIVLTGIVFSAVLAGFVVMERHAETLTRDGLSQLLRSRIDLFLLNLELRSTRAALIATRPNLLEQMEKLSVNPADAEALARLRGAAASFMPYDLSALAFYDVNGGELLSSGKFVENGAFEIGIQSAYAASLLWENGFVLRLRMPMLQNGRIAGSMTVEQRLPILTSALQGEAGSSDSGETVVCGGDMLQIECFPQRFVPRPYRIQNATGLPITHALAGESGVLIARDLRRENVIAAHGPIGSFGLGMVVKMDTAELYQPLRENMYTVFALMSLLLAAGVWLLYRNVTPLARELAQSEERLQLALAASRIALWDWDARSKHIRLSEQWEEILGRPARATTSQLQELFQIVHPDERKALNENLVAVLAGDIPEYDIEHRVQTQDGGWKWIRSHGKVVERDQEGRARRLIGTNVDISASKEAELHLQHQATHDALTGLPNRSLFADRLSQSIARAQRGRSLMAVMYLDIDKFKGINDTLGHDAGDALLKEFSVRLAGAVRNTDTAARLGGDEFAVILEVLSAREEGCHIAEKIVVAMRPGFAIGRGALNITTSAGLAFYAGEPGIYNQLLLSKADKALYKAKATGRNNYQVAD